MDAPFRGGFEGWFFFQLRRLGLSSATGAPLSFALGVHYQSNREEKMQNFIDSTESVGSLVLFFLKLIAPYLAALFLGVLLFFLVIYLKLNKKQITSEKTSQKDVCLIEKTSLADSNSGSQNQTIISLIVELRDEGYSYSLIANEFKERNVPIPKNTGYQEWKPELVQLVETGGVNDGIENTNLTEFSDYYLKGLKKNLKGFSKFFGFIGVMFWLQVSIAVIATFIVMVKVSLFGALELIVLSFYLTVILWFSSLCKQLVNLQTKKVENDIYNTIAYRLGSIKMAQEILKKAEQKAENRITINGDNAVFAFDGGSVSGVTQTKTVEGGSELLQSLALLVSYCELQGDEKAIELAKQLSEEATKQQLNKGKIFDLWNQITVAIPQVAGIVKIAQGVKALFIG
ncbi:MAG: hypothetical protein ACXW1F_05850 [Halobacteriota archaeon]